MPDEEDQANEVQPGDPSAPHADAHHRHSPPDRLTHLRGLTVHAFLMSAPSPWSCPDSAAIAQSTDHENTLRRFRLPGRRRTCSQTGFDSALSISRTSSTMPTYPA